MSDIRFNQWLHNSGTGGISQDSAGHVGIGTTVPTHINALTNNNSILHVGIVSCNTLNAASKIEGSIDDWIIHQSDTNTRFGFPAADTFTVETAGTERLRITSDGKVGMGVPSTSPGSTCNPDGNQLLIRAASTVGTTKGHIMLSGDGATVGEGPQIVFSESGSGGNFAGAYIGHVRSGSNSIGDLVFGTRSTSGDANTVPTERLRIQNDGTVYFRGSSSSDSHRLQIRVNDTDTEFRGSSSSGTNKGFAFYSSNTNGSEKVRIGSDGTVTLQTEDLVFGTTGKGIEFPNSVSLKQNVSNLYANLASGNNNIEFQSNGTSFVKFRGTNGNVEIVDGDLLISTAGHGIDFGAQTASSATGATTNHEVLDHYEEGDWTPTNPHISVSSVYSARYVKVGKIVHISFAIMFASSPADTSQTAWIDGLPFQAHNKAQYITLDWTGTSSSLNRSANTEHVIFANSSRITFYYPAGAHAQTRAHVAGKQVRATFTYLAST